MYNVCSIFSICDIPFTTAFSSGILTGIEPDRAACGLADVNTISICMSGFDSDQGRSEMRLGERSF